MTVKPGKKLYPGQQPANWVRPDGSVVKATNPVLRNVAIGIGAVVWVTIVSLSIAINNSKPSDPSVEQTASASSAETSAQSDRASILKAFDDKIAPVALLPLDGRYDLNGYAKLGSRVWGMSNDLRRWAAIAALQNDACNYVSAIAVWEEATRAHLSWHIVCSDKRFIVSEEQARSAKARFDPTATPTKEQVDQSMIPAQLDEGTAPVETSQASALAASDAGTACMDAARDRIGHPSTADFSILGSGFKSFDDGTSTFTTTFTARNSFNLELEYQLACEFTGAALTDVTIVEAR